MARPFSVLGHALRKPLLASLIVCVALLAQLGASLWGAAAAREVLIECHKNIAWSARADIKRSAESGRQAPAQTPSRHDHASCSLCQLGFSFVHKEATTFEARAAAHERVRIAEPRALAPIIVFNRSAPARASPSRA
jgi:hypothetical protein